MEKVVCEPLAVEQGRNIDDETIAELAERFLSNPDEMERLSKFIQAYIIDDSESFLTAARGGDNVRFSVVHATFVDPTSGTIYQLRSDESGYHKEVYKCATQSFHGVLAVPARVFDARSTSDLRQIGADFYSSDGTYDNMRPLLESPRGYEPEHSTELQPNRNSLRMQKNDDGSIEGWVNDGVAEREHRVYLLDDVIARMERIVLDTDRDVLEVEVATSAEYTQHLGQRAVNLGAAA